MLEAVDDGAITEKHKIVFYQYYQKQFTVSKNLLMLC